MDRNNFDYREIVYFITANKGRKEKKMTLLSPNFSCSVGICTGRRNNLFRSVLDVLIFLTVRRCNVILRNFRE
jgi:hypothetical protein